MLVTPVSPTQLYFLGLLRTNARAFGLYQLGFLCEPGAFQYEMTWQNHRGTCSFDSILNRQQDGHELESILMSELNVRVDGFDDQQRT